MIFNEVIVPTNSGGYGMVVCNIDGSLVGGGSSSSTPYTMLAYYNTADLSFNYSYYAEAIPGTIITENKWRVFRIQEDKSGKFISKTWAGTLFNNLGDETTIKSLTYS